MKKFLLSILVVSFLGLSQTFANTIDFVGEQNPAWNLQGANLEKIQKEIDVLQTQYGINMDVVILGPKDSKGCYSITAYDSCLQESYFYNSDILVGIKMKSAYSNRGDIRSLIKDEYIEIIPAFKLKEIQDKIIYNFKKENFTKGILEYISLLDNEIKSVCSKISDGQNCKIQYLLTEIEDYKTGLYYKRIASIVFLIVFIVGILYIKRRIYINRLKNLLKDMKYYSLELKEFEIFDEDREKFKKQLDNTIDILESYLGNLDKRSYMIKKHYNVRRDEFLLMQKQLTLLVENFTSQKDLKNQVNDMKNIDL